ncbi:MAG: type II toxin-antitoxin system HicA family toxin [Myxococcota bacterium]|nr:type II toxin-antitoxin system HicA family toxin [Myxococcota bacterium]
MERVLRKLGFVEDRQRGGHSVLVRAADDSTIVLPWHRRDLKRGTLRAIIKAAGLTVEEFVRLRQAAPAGPRRSLAGRSG